MKPFRLVPALAMCFTSLCLAAEPSYPTLALGASAPDFKLPGVDGRTWSLSDFKEGIP
jgi:hypothetical protein